MLVPEGGVDVFGFCGPQTALEIGAGIGGCEKGELAIFC